MQFQERHRSEKINRELKAMLARQRKLERSVCKLLGRENALEGMELLCRLQPMPESVNFISDPQPKFDLSDAILVDLESTVAALYVRTNSVFPTLQGEPVLSFSAKDSYADPLGTYIETRTTTPLSCPLHVAAEILWSETSKKSQDPEKMPRFVRAKCMNTLARSCKLDLFNTVRIDGINFVRRYIDSDRVVLWMHKMPQLSRAFVSLERRSMKASKEAFASAQEYIRGAVGTKLRHLQEMQQKVLLKHTGSPVDVS